MPRIDLLYRWNFLFAGHANSRCTGAGRAAANDRLPAQQHGLQRQGEMRRPSARRLEGDYRVQCLRRGGRAACAGGVALPLQRLHQQAGGAGAAGLLLDHHHQPGNYLRSVLPLMVIFHNSAT
jgi:hypothetical protein